jgi:CBS domain-containing protein
MKVSEIMTPNVEVLSPSATLQEAAQKMRDLDVGSIPVCDGERIQGIVTDRDITIRATADGYDPKSTSIDLVMTPGVHWCYEDDDLEAAEKLMKDHQVRRILVMNRDKKLTGIVSLGDVAVDANQDRETAQTLEGISQPAQPHSKAA